MCFDFSKDFSFYECKTYQELEVLTDPMRKEVATVRKKIDVANREVRSLGQSCQKKVRTFAGPAFRWYIKQFGKFFYTDLLMSLIQRKLFVLCQQIGDIAHA